MSQRRQARLVAGAAIVVLATPLLVAGCSPPPLRVELFGDSLAWESRSYFTAQLATRSHHPTVVTQTMGGTALCDWLARMRSEAATFKPQAVVVEFSGNNLTPCTQGKNGQPLTGAALVSKYQADVAEVMRIFAPTGTRVYLASAPISRRDGAAGTIGQTVIGAMYKRIALTFPHARFVDAAAAVLDHGRYTDTLPCLPAEPCGIMAPTGYDRVRAPDGGHFCPQQVATVDGVTAPCPVYSSGARRYGFAMAGPIISDYRL